jgi:hypothetical protein
MIIAGVILLMVAVLMAGIGVASGVGSVKGFGEGMQAVALPGTTRVTLPEAKTYYIYHEMDANSSEAMPAGAAVDVVGPDGSPVGVSRVTMDMNYNTGGRKGRAVWSFDAPKAGEYQLTTKASPESPAADLMVGGNVMGMIGGIFGAVCGLIGGGILGLVGLVLLIIGLVRRSKAT